MAKTPPFNPSLLTSAITATAASASSAASSASGVSTATKSISRNSAQLVGLQKTGNTLYLPSLTLSAMSSQTGLANAGAGGIVAAVNGVSGTGYVQLPVTIDPTKLFRISVLMEVSDSTNNIVIQPTSAAKPYWSGPKAYFRNNGISLDVGTAGVFNSIGNTAPAPNGTQFWLSIASDGNHVTLASIPNIAKTAFTTAGIKQSPVFADAYNQINFKQDPLNNASAGAGNYSWGEVGTANLISQITISNASATSRVIGLHVCIGALDGPIDYQMGAPCLVSINSGQESGVANNGYKPYVILPKYYGGPKDTSIVLLQHPNGNPGQITYLPSMDTLLTLWLGGYAVSNQSGLHGASIDITGPTCSNWGSPAGLTYRKLFSDYIRQNLPFIGKFMHLGMSMGGLNSLSYVREYGESSAIVTISGAVGLTDSFNSRGFSSIINNAYGAWYVFTAASTNNDPASSPAYAAPINSGELTPSRRFYSAPFNWRGVYSAGTSYVVNDVVVKPYSAGVSGLAGYDPTLTPSLFTGIPVKMWHGDADSLIPLSQMTEFASAVNAAGGSVQTVTVSGGAHLGASMFDSAAIKEFFDLYVDV